MTKKQKTMLYRIVITASIYVPLFILEHMGKREVQAESSVVFLMFFIPYIVVGWDVLYRAIRNLRHGQIFDENFLMCIATFGAFALKEYSEAVAVMLFYQIGELFQSYAVGKSRQSISEMMNICPEYANVEQDGELVQVDPEEVEIDQVIVIKAGERLPLDGVVVWGNSFVDTSALTGESVPQEVKEGSPVISGCVNGSGLLKVRVTKTFENSTVSRILELVENAASKKAKVENFITRFAKYYTPLVVCAALALAVVPPLFVVGSSCLNNTLLDIGLAELFGEWVNRACIFLVISCPCALVISVPLGFFGGIGAASKQGVLVKGSNYLEMLSDMKMIVFDKTGTLTKGEFSVTKIVPCRGTKEELLEMAALVESYSDHPISKALKEAHGKEIFKDRIGHVKEIPGHGIEALIDGEIVYAGNTKLLEEKGICYEVGSEKGTIVCLAKEQHFWGYIVIADVIKQSAKQVISELKQNGVLHTVMLTGDRQEVGKEVAARLGIQEVYTELLPGDKVEKVEEFLETMKGKGRLGFVGDGINDAPVLRRADIGIAMGNLGADAAIEAADIILMNDDIMKISSAMKIAKKTLRIVKQNIIFSLGVKVIVLLLGAFGMANMWGAVFADVGVSVIAILNSMRVLRTKAL